MYTLLNLRKRDILMNTFHDSNDAYQYSFIIITTTFIGLSFIVLLMEMQITTFVVRELLQATRAVFGFFTERSVRFYLLLSGFIFFALPSCLLLLLSLRSSPSTLKASIDEEAAYWRSYSPSTPSTISHSTEKE